MTLRTITKLLPNIHIRWSGCVFFLFFHFVLRIFCVRNEEQRPRESEDHLMAAKGSEGDLEWTLTVGPLKITNNRRSTDNLTYKWNIMSPTSAFLFSSSASVSVYSISKTSSFPESSSEPNESRKELLNSEEHKDKVL